MKQSITDETLDRASKELKVQRKIVSILKKVKDPVKRARVMRAVIALHGLDE